MVLVFFVLGFDEVDDANAVDSKLEARDRNKMTQIQYNQMKRETLLKLLLQIEQRHLKSYRTISVLNIFFWIFVCWFGCTETVLISEVIVLIVIKVCNNVCRFI